MDYSAICTALNEVPGKLTQKPGNTAVMERQSRRGWLPALPFLLCLVMLFPILAGCGLSDKEQERANTRLLMSIQENSLSEVRKWLKAGADVDAKDENGIPALLWAIGNGNRGVRIVNTLIDQGADVNIQDQKGNTPLLDALKYYRYKRQRELVDLLLEKGADVSLSNDRGLTPLIRAVRYSTAISRTLINEGADVNTASKSGLTPLMNAAGSGAVATIKRLLENGAKVNAADKTGDTALMSAARTGSRKRIMLLLENGAEINARDDMGNTALRYVINHSYNPDLVQLMLKKGADPVAENQEGQTLWGLAQEKGFWKVGWLLEEAGAPGGDEKKKKPEDVGTDKSTNASKKGEENSSQ